MSFCLFVLSVCSVVRRADEEEERRKGEEPSIYYFCLFGAVSVQLMHHRIKVDYIGGHSYKHEVQRHLNERIKTNE